MIRHACVAALVAVGAAACAGDPPTAELSAADEALSNAQSARAGEFAPQQLSLAEDKLFEARQLSEDGDYEAARALAIEARADARVARAEAEARDAEQAEEEIQRSNEALARQAGEPPREPETTTRP